MSPYKLVWFICFMLLLAACVPAGSPLPVPTTTLAMSTPTSATETATETPLPRSQTAAPRPLLCECGARYLLLEQGIATPLGLPETLIGQYYDFAPATRQILYASKFPDHGAGPASLAVSDLLTYDIVSGESTSIMADEIVVRAEWAPDGESIVYVAATESTYELRWRPPDGSEQVLAIDVSPFFHTAPSATKIAFTRESPYADAAPGVFVVDVASGEERQLSDLDRGGTGSLDEKPVWTPDEDAVYMRIQRSEELNGLFHFPLDGSPATQVTFDPALAEQEWYNFAPLLGLWLSPTEVLGTAFPYNESTPMGGQPTVIHYTLDETGAVILDGTVITEAMLLGWNVPDKSIWVLPDHDPEVVALP